MGLQFPGEVPSRDVGKERSREPGNSPASSDKGWTVKGAQAPVARRPNNKTKKYEPQKSVGRPVKTQKPKVRNYNIRDDPQTR